MTTDHNIANVAGVGPKRAAQLLSSFGVRTVGDMLTCYPFRYVDRTRFYHISEVRSADVWVQLRGRFLSFERKGVGMAQRLCGVFSDGSGKIEIVWFNKGIRYVEASLRLNTEYILFGKPTEFNGHLNIAHPEVDLYNEKNIKKNNGLQGYYSIPEKTKNKFTQQQIRLIIYNILTDRSLTIPETLPQSVIAQYALMGRDEALRAIHFPQSADQLGRAKSRLKFEELFYIQLAIMRNTKLRQMRYAGYIFSTVGDYFNRFYREILPFDLTDAQKRVIREIRTDMATGRQMNRLLQGDVGSGKTMVATMSALIALDNGFQACLMAPTEILAAQHYAGISEQLSPLGIEVRLLTGSTTKKHRETILQELTDGTAQLIIGTHALIEDTVVFQNLGLVIIDEQHRFGVAQRAKLWSKNIQPPHILVMTATPIPRTLAMTIYGDLDVSVIDQLPPGRKPIATYHFFDNRRAALNHFLRQQITAGRQVYIVYPMIQENEKIDLKNLEQGYLATCEAFPDMKIAMVHGKMKARDKESAMNLFASGEAQIMVATTVIEVGVNVPNASVMVIESAERFGLSQLHQLRGRVGRGADQSYCILMSKMELATDSRRRLQTMCDSTDGFVIAEADLNLRGPGDMDGVQQSGLPFDLKIANLASDGRILQAARHTAKEILTDDPELSLPAHHILLHNLTRLQKSNINWAAIS